MSKSETLQHNQELPWARLNPDPNSRAKDTFGLVEYIIDGQGKCLNRDEEIVDSAAFHVQGYVRLKFGLPGRNAFFVRTNDSRARELDPTYVVEVQEGAQEFLSQLGYDEANEEVIKVAESLARLANGIGASSSLQVESAGILGRAENRQKEIPLEVKASAQKLLNMGVFLVADNSKGQPSGWFPTADYVSEYPTNRIVSINE